MLVGTAGWTLPREVQDRFSPGESHLARYASVFPVTEINSSFHRPHKLSLYEKWANSVPDGFRFCAKLPKTITHERRLVDCEPLVAEFLAQAGGLGGKLACLLVQLPPSFAFDASSRLLLRMLRTHWEGELRWSPRHVTWFDDDAMRCARPPVARVCGPGAPPTARRRRLARAHYLRLLVAACYTLVRVALLRTAKRIRTG